MDRRKFEKELFDKLLKEVSKGSSEKNRSKSWLEILADGMIVYALKKKK